MYTEHSEYVYVTKEISDLCLFTRTEVHTNNQFDIYAVYCIIMGTIELSEVSLESEVLLETSI